MREVIKKYKTFLIYIAVSISSFLIDISFFTLFNYLIPEKIVLVTIMARIISSSFNYLMNKKKVFQTKEKTSTTLWKYFSLVIIQMLISGLVVDQLFKMIKINASLIKIPVELLLFISSYLIQKIFIFKKGDKHHA